MKIERKLDKNKAYLQERFHQNSDIKFRDFTVGGRDGCVIFVDGMTNKAEINEFVLMVMQRDHTQNSEPSLPEGHGQSPQSQGGAGRRAGAKAKDSKSSQAKSQNQSASQQQTGQESAQ